MRPIKFRVWNIETKKISYPFSIQECSWGILGDVSDFNCPGFSGGIDVEVMQWTGLLDKNGKEIYEGDVIDIDGKGYTVKWEEEMAGFNPFVFQIPEAPDVYSEFMFKDNGTIMGNIHENPELLPN